MSSLNNKLIDTYFALLGKHVCCSSALVVFLFLQWRFLLFYVIFDHYKYNNFVKGVFVWVSFFCTYASQLGDNISFVIRLCFVSSSFTFMVWKEDGGGNIISGIKPTQYVCMVCVYQSIIEWVFAAFFFLFIFHYFAVIEPESSYTSSSYVQSSRPPILLAMILFCLCGIFSFFFFF